MGPGTPSPPPPLLLTPSLTWREKGLVPGGRGGGRAPAAVGPSEVVCVLSPSYGDQVQHFKVLREASGKYYLWEEKFNSLNELVAFYRTSTIAKKRQVLLRDEEPLAKPPRACFVQAQFDFSAQDPSQLSFRHGDIIEVLERLDPCWWRGRLCGRVGFFPRSYVQPVHL
ncbi:GRB2-related adapter protein-like [Physeter macrocephalus]|uniref:GRB2-related adapter protein-like n=1 Tax=Physeter macrocephalus TaxID=9755 RepID=A0A2Y9T5H2_PHYMC|nr:GRB2-related adapter protein-like [Physeter catodon]|eukprot:XP_023983369.1 GRB2-related adapter protein-like [Physeter catodon]